MISKFKLTLLIFYTLLSLIQCLRISHKSLDSSQQSHSQTVVHQAYKDNLQAQNWYYGNISATDYRVRIFQAASTQTLNTCPISTPYITSDMNNCQSCPISTPLRNLGTYLCQVCPTGYQYSTNTGNCTINNNNTTTTTTTNTNANSNSNVVNNNNNMTTVTTNNGPTPTVVTPVSPTTTTTTTTTATTTTTSNNSSGSSDNSTSNTNITFGNTNADNVYFANNTQNNTTTTTTTVTPTTVTPTTTVTNTSASTSTNSTIGIIYNCTKTTPLYNPTTGNCSSCPTTTQYINITNQCLPILYITNLQKATNLIQPSYNYTYNQNIDIINQHPTRTVQSCPASTPYLSSKNSTYGVCVACNTSLYFAVATQTCITGCPKGTIYNSTQKLCKIGEYFTNPAANNLLSPTNTFSTWQSNTQNNKNNTINGQYCPTSTPYEINGQCVACNGNNGTLFDIQNKICRNCGNGRNYNADKKICQSSYSTGLSVSRMIANIL